MEINDKWQNWRFFFPFQCILAETVLEVLSADPRFATLVSAIEKTDLKEILSGGYKYIDKHLFYFD